MEIKLVFNDWRGWNKDGYGSIYNTEKGVELSLGDLHSGSTFDATIEVDEETAAQLTEAIKEGYIPQMLVDLPKTPAIT